MAENEITVETPDDERSSPPFALSASPAHLLRRTQQFAAEIFSNAGIADGVTLRQSVVLAAIAEREGLSQSDLVTSTGIDRSTLADMIARMQAKGLVSRKSAIEDARAKSVSLTDRGRAALVEAQPALESVDNTLLEILPRNRRKAFVDLLQKITTFADTGELDHVSADEGDDANAGSNGKKKKKKKSKTRKGKEKSKAKKSRK